MYFKPIFEWSDICVFFILLQVITKPWTTTSKLQQNWCLGTLDNINDSSMKDIHLLPWNLRSLTLGYSVLSIPSFVSLPLVLNSPFTCNFFHNLLQSVPLSEVQLWLASQWLNCHSHKNLTNTVSFSWGTKTKAQIFWRSTNTGLLSLSRLQGRSR